jgi:hypothetical protein
VVRIEFDGYLPFEGRLTRRLSKWALLDLPWMLVPVPPVVDAITGGGYTLRPTILSAELKRSSPPGRPRDASAPPARPPR